MFSNKLFRGLIAVLTLWCCTFTIQGQVQNTYFNGSNHDHYSPTPSLSVTGNTVMAGTIETAAGLDIHVIEIDPTGAIVWEQVYITPEDDRAFDIIGIDNSYLIVGLTTQNTIETALAMEIDLAGAVVNTQTYLDPMYGSGSRLLHVNRVQGDATGGGFIAAGWVGGNQLSMPKSGLLLRIDAGLNFTWARFFESVSGNNDYDMCSNVIETPGKGFFVSGSSNATYGDQLVLAAQVDYGNNLSWETSWADNSGSGHYQVGASAYYDQQTEQVYQLANLSIIHHFGVNKFDVNTGVRDVFNSWRLFSNFGYANIQGFRIQESLADPNNLIIAGYMREHTWQEVDENGNNTGVTQSGSVPFQMEMPKLPGAIIAGGGNPIIWDQMYLVPSPGFNIANDIYDSFSAGQQPRIYHPEMDMPSVFGNGYQLTAYRGLAVGGPYELEFIETDLNGVNPCSSAPLGFVTASVQWFDNPVIETEPLSLQGFPISIPEQPGNHQFGPCPDNFGDPCTLDPVIDVAQEDCDTFRFFGVNNGVALSADVCFEWNFGDGNVSNAINPTHTYAADGVYTACLKVWCCDDPSTAVDVCQDVVVDCCDDPVPGISWECDGDQIIITATHNGVPASPNEYCWVWEDGTAGGTYTIPLIDCDGSYGVCLQMFCCDEDPANAATVCFDFVADCCTCEPLPASDIDFSWGPTGIDPFCPDGCSIGFNCPIIDPDLYCVEWDFGDGTTFTDPNQCPIHCFQCSGVYEVCLTVYCCDDPNISTTVCHEVEVNCCTLPSNVDFALTYGQDECTVITDMIMPDVPCPNDFCFSWDMGDGTVYPGVAGVTHTYPASGVYTICLTVFCCSDPSINYTICQQFDANCPVPCELPNQFGIDVVSNPNDCSVGFCIDPSVFPAGTDLSLYCTTWNFGDGTVEDYPVDVCPQHFYECSGVYDVCVDLYCCDDPDTRITMCIPVEVNCCNLPTNADFALTYGQDECTVVTDIILPDVPCPEDLCWSWDMGDGTVYSNVAGVNHTYASSGVYNVCLTIFCCLDPSINYTICYEFDAICPEPCELPNQFDFDVFTDPANASCELGFCIPATMLPPGANPDDYCTTWSFGDGTVADYPFAFCPVHTYECSGEYEVCVDIYCCDEPDVRVTSCQIVTVDCCTLPTNVDIALTYGQDDCTVVTEMFLPFTPCPNDFCFTWDMGDGTVYPGIPSVTHTYGASGVYNVCLTVYCCNDPSINYTICQEFDANCPEPCELPNQFDFDVFDDPTNASCELGFCIPAAMLPPGANPDDYCTTWSFGDGTVADYPFAFCPVHTYECSGEYEVCVDIYCCDEPDVRVTSCQIVTVDCCTLPTNVDIALTYGQDDCTVVTEMFLPFTPCPNDFCFTWDMGDGTVYPGIPSVTHTYGASGVYNVCLTVYCCNDPSINYTICQEFDANCPVPCELPNQFDIEVVNNAADCSVGFCIDPTAFPAGTDLSQYCTTWYFGDGTIADYPVDVCPEHTYECSGVYEVCVDLYCCDEPDNRITMCVPVEVDCCNLPTNADIALSYGDDECTVVGELFLPISPCPNDFCIDWDMGDGTIYSGVTSVTHTYGASGVYNVCVTIYCCNDPSINYTICQEFDALCDDPCPKPCELHPVFIVQDQDDCTYQFYNMSVAGTYTTITSYSWDFGDGNTSTLSDPSHTYAGSGTYTVCLTITGVSPEGTCQETFCWTVEADCYCDSDVNQDGQISIADLLQILSSFGSNSCN